MKDYSFGNYICALRTGLGLSQYQLGNLVGVTDKAVSKWENGDAKPRLATCYRLATVLGVDIDELLSCNPDMKNLTRKELNNMNQALWKKAYERLSIFGANPPALCLSRLASEEAAFGDTDAIQCFFVLGKINEAQGNYLAAHALDLPAASFASWLLGGTKINPLPPHYRCPKCGKTEFMSSVSDGFDLPPKNCSCGEEYLRDGHNIPFEGYVRSAHHGLHIPIHVSDKFEATVEKIIQDYYTGKARILPIRLTKNNYIRPVKYYVVLHDQDPYPDLCDDGFWHLSLDTYHQYLETHTCYTLFPGSHLPLLHALQLQTEAFSPDFSSYGSEQMVKHYLAHQQESSDRTAAMLFPDLIGKNTLIQDMLSFEPYNFSLLCKIEGLHHSSNAWYNNGELLVRNKKIDPKSLPAFREDIFNDISLALNSQGIRDTGLALKVMDETRKGHYRSDGMPTYVEDALRSLPLPGWYPEYLKKVTYLHSKGNCLTMLYAYLLIDWYRIHYPEEFTQLKLQI